MHLDQVPNIMHVGMMQLDSKEILVQISFLVCNALLRLVCNRTSQRIKNDETNVFEGVEMYKYIIISFLLRVWN
jgi:hypothetical protein